MSEGSGQATRGVESRHRDNFAFLRLFAAFLVLVSHQNGLTGRFEYTFFGLHSFAGLGVVIFFSISGFLVAQSWDADPHVGRFAARRLLRVWPGYAANIVLTAIVVGPLVTDLTLQAYFRHPVFLDYFRNLWFQMRGALPARFDHSALPIAVNGSLWTIPLELKCYVVLAVLGASGLLARRWVPIALAAMLSLAYAGWQLRGGVWEAALKLNIEGLYFIEFGACFLTGVAFHKAWPFISGHRLLVIGLLCGVLAPLAWMAGRPILWMLLTVPALAVVFGKSCWPIVSRFDRLGDLSYGVYLYAFPVQQTIIWGLTGRMHWWPRLFLTVAVTLLCAYLSWHLIEKRALRLKPRAAGAGGLALRAA